MTNIEMNHGINSRFNKKHFLQALIIVPLLGIVTFTGCSHIDGTADRQRLTKNGMLAKDGVVVYSEWKQEKPQTDSNPDPGYKWFY